jgi:hypothetical protein
MDKKFSRKSAKAQRKPNSFFAPLRLCGVIVFFLFFSTSWSPALAQNKSARFDPDGSFWIIGTPPNEFSDFSAINLNAKKLRRLPSPGVQINNGTTYRFKTLTVKQNDFNFTTVARGGVSYTFSGKFLKGGNFAATWSGDEEPVLEGTLTKFRNGKKLAEAKLKFSYFGGT